MRRAAALVGVAFGFLLSWGQATSPDRIREMLLLEDPYLYLMLGSGVLVASAGVRLLRRARVHALVTAEPVSWETLRPERRHVVGSVMFGAGWAVSDACPGPIAAQLGQGVAWSLFTLAGVVIGIGLYLRTQERAQPAAAPSPARG